MEGNKGRETMKDIERKREVERQKKKHIELKRKNFYPPPLMDKLGYLKKHLLEWTEKDIFYIIFLFCRSVRTWLILY